MTTSVLTVSKRTNRRPMTSSADLSPEGVCAALNQIACVLAGRELALKTNDLADTPHLRIESMLQVASAQLIEAATAGDSKALNQATRKTQSLSSLMTLAELTTCHVDWSTVR